MTKIKICGITNLEDARVAAEAGADMLGFIFYKPSPRYVAPELARDIITELKTATRPANRTPLFVGVFVNEPLSAIEKILQMCGLDRLQLHGDESPEFVARFRGRAYKALRPRSLQEAEALIPPYLPCLPARRPPCLLLDAYHPTLYGGTGRVTDWTMAAAVARRAPVLLAGSLTPHNVAEAVRLVRPWGVDVSSGVEAVKGKKDHKKVRAFIQAVNYPDKTP